MTNPFPASPPPGWFSKRKIVRTSEFERINNLPRRAWSEAELTELAEKMTALLKTPNGTWKLRPKQALALHDIGVYNGLVGSLRVGGGKTLISMLAPVVLEPKPRVPLLILPAALIGKTEKDRELLAKHWKVARNLRIISFEFLGRIGAANFFDVYKPDLIIIDEAHRAKNKKAGVTKRLIRYMRENPQTRVVILSGTVVKKGLKDAAHLIKWALKDGSPIPLHDGELEEWADALDDGVNALRRVDPGPLVTLAAGGPTTGDPLTDARRAFRRRLSETPGFVETTGDQVDCSLNISALRYEEDPVTNGHFDTLRSKWETPDGYALTEAVAVWAHARQLALGFHYVQADPEGWERCRSKIRQNEKQRTETTGSAISTGSGPTTGSEARSGTPLSRLTTFAKRATGSAESSTNVSSQSTEVGATSANGHPDDTDSASTTATRRGESEDCSVFRATGQSAFLATASMESKELFNTLLQEARPPKPWLDARRAWAKFVRDTLSRSRTLDTELQVKNAVKSGALRSPEFDDWARIEPTFTPVLRAVWHDDSALQACQAWIEKHPGIVWVEHTTFGHELSRRTGAPYFFKEAKTAEGDSLPALADAIRNGKEKLRPIICSIASCGTGQNLQPWNQNLITTGISQAADLEQLLGRTHRDGQQADEVMVEMLLGCREHWDAWQRARSQAKATEDTYGADQKVLIATVDFPEEAEIVSLQGARWQKVVQMKQTAGGIPFAM